MAIVSAYQCSYTKKFFGLDDKERYIKHLKTVAKYDMLKKACKRRIAARGDTKLKLKQSESLAEFKENLHQHLLTLIDTDVINGDDQNIKRNRSMIKKSILTDLLIDNVVLYSSNIQMFDFLHKTHGPTRSSYMGIEMNLAMEVSADFGSISSVSDLFKNSGMSVNSGSYGKSSNTNSSYRGCYTVRLYAEEWPFIAKEACVLGIVQMIQTGQDPNGYVWSEYKRLIQTHWPKQAAHIHDELKLGVSLGLSEIMLQNMLSDNLKVSQQNITPDQIKPIELPLLDALI